MGVTRMQPAIPITRLRPHRGVAAAAGTASRAAVRAMRRGCWSCSSAAPAGTLDKLGDKAAAVRAALAGQARPRRRAAMAQPARRARRLRGWLSLVTGSLGKFGQDIALMALDGGEIALSRRRRLVGDAAQAEPGDGRGAGRAGALQRRRSFPACTRRWCTSRSARARPGRSNGCCCRRWWWRPPPRLRLRRSS